jgi:hypothetical protein
MALMNWKKSILFTAAAHCLIFNVSQEQIDIVDHDGGQKGSLNHPRRLECGLSHRVLSSTISKKCTIQGHYTMVLLLPKTPRRSWALAARPWVAASWPSAGLGQPGPQQVHQVPEWPHRRAHEILKGTLKLWMFACCWDMTSSSCRMCTAHWAKAT